jgi:hypothetical protein
MLPPDILDQLSSLSLLQRTILTNISRFSRLNDITTIPSLDALSTQLKSLFLEADKSLEVPLPQEPT